ncbi:bifunctional 4-hydroxy-2-oxoglutarate aldolase/2-dehydro-3-deoxy-phosphogluconate aldolase [Flavihumibacter fluvii]|uniref:bifunctional 4-hydroxy-2-oxoglutarate aldolase/2-dehydro-3-deoxy-phosphogluconate aldolase n=1 Tax=Flavihumibacter fluvii TaxID=2838157 RepID=UPI001BDE90EA|nr:bifunctional 4-hydroxy-2-oxoglutarate aldolase/2-dehydro-3-deoxy-phosphogluconate aldolase [Flavihumibacter fluvii]ULQ54048.1 bifunctional 4-hydroxy-2-oxoglutarate aldolase/2-dehydro-3-deoxy-phosphogluconate aldolase [Flavihumibacter fluvii]
MAAFSLPVALQQKILPAITFDALEDVLPVAEALLEAGLNVMEIPFRTAIAEKSVKLIRTSFPEMFVGAGTLLNTIQLRMAADAGAQFGLSPGLNQTVCLEAMKINFPFIPGVMTPSEIELAAEMGFGIQKLFPAEQLGGIAFLKALQGPYDQLKVKFIPMGGVNIRNATAYSQLKNVIAIGGSWLATTELMATKKYSTIQENVTTALQLVK